MKKRNQLLGEILKEKGLITEANLEEALKLQKVTKEFLGAIMVKRRFIKEKDLMEAISEQSGMPIMSLKDLYIDWDIVKRFSSSVILQDKCFPVKTVDGSLVIATLNPLDAWALKRAEDAGGSISTRFVLVTSADMEEVIKRYKQFVRNTVDGMLG